MSRKLPDLSDRDLERLLGRKGRNGDTLVAHISPEEAGILKRLGGSGTRNPETGLLEFWGLGGGVSSGGHGDTGDGSGGSSGSGKGANTGHGDRSGATQHGVGPAVGGGGVAMTAYRKQKDGEWVAPVKRGYKMACCDCGLVHIGPASFIDFMPTTAHAATAKGGLYISARSEGSATLTHANTADIDKTFGVIIM